MKSQVQPLSECSVLCQKGMGCFLPIISLALWESSSTHRDLLPVPGP